jgi:hypothetical protein
MCAYAESDVGCFQSSEGFSQATPTRGASPRLILLLFGGIPNSPGFKENASGMRAGPKVTEVTRTGVGRHLPFCRAKIDSPFSAIPQENESLSWLEPDGVGVKLVEKRNSTAMHGFWLLAARGLFLGWDPHC